jgi:hypothetical protein
VLVRAESVGEVGQSQESSGSHEDLRELVLSRDERHLGLWIDSSMET